MQPSRNVCYHILITTKFVKMPRSIFSIEGINKHVWHQIKKYEALVYCVTYSFLIEGQWTVSKKNSQFLQYSLTSSQCSLSFPLKCSCYHGTNLQVNYIICYPFMAIMVHVINGRMMPNNRMH